MAQSPAPSGTVITIAGNGSYGYSGDGGPATNAMLRGVHGLAVGPEGTLYFADTGNYRIRAVDPITGIVRTVAGTGIRGESGNNGPATNAAIGEVISLAVDRSRNALYVPEWDNNWVRKVNLPNGLLTVYAGTGVFGMGFEGDGGPATAAYLNLPESVALDAAGKLFIGDVFNQRIRQVDSVTGFISTIAGNGSYGFSGDGGPATNASLSDLLGVAADGPGNVFAIDGEGSSRRARRIDALTGLITTIAGGGTNMAGTGLATNMSFTDVHVQKMAANNAGELYLSGLFRVFKLNLTSGLIAPYAGDGIGGSFGGDGGPATNAVFGQILALAVPPGGGLIIADGGHARIRYVVPDSINLTNDSGQTAFYLPWVSALAGDLTIAHNPNLTNVDAASLTTVSGSLDISGNTAAAAINMSSLTTVAGGLELSGNISVGELDLGSLVSAGSLTITGNTAAAAIDMSSLTSVSGGLELNGNISVGELDLSSLVSAGSLTITGNTAAAAIDMGSLTSVSGDLTIASNAPITVVNMAALSNFGCGTNEVTITLDGGTFTMTNGLTLCTNATLTGSTTVEGSVTNSGTIEPGSSPGNLNITGSLVLLPGSRLRFELGGSAAGSQYDQIKISNVVTCGGTVAVQFINGFTPSAGQVFQLINAPSRLGAFPGVSLPGLPAGLSWTNRLDVDGSIAVVVLVAPPELLNPVVLGNGSFQFGFSNAAGASFTVLTTTNVAWPLSNWTALGPPAEISPGQFQFTDLQNTNDAQRFYSVRQP